MSFRLVLGLLLLWLGSLAQADWTPPANPNPMQILQQARDDTAAARYDDALSKFVWFHRHALKYQPNLEGVRVSFALSYWKALGDVYLPAREQLFAARDAAFDEVKLGSQLQAAFRDLASINRVLQQPENTAAAFSWIDSNKPASGKDVVDLARAALIQTGAYELCAKYLDAEAALNTQLKVYREIIGRSTGPKDDPSILQRAPAAFAREAGGLVALLVKVNRQEEAQRLADRAAKEVPNAGLQETLKRALQGEFPK